MSKKYSQKMLPGVHYEELGDGFEGRVLDLEYETLQNLTNLTEGLKEILLAEELIQVHELILAHLCGYLGYLTSSCLGKEEAVQLGSSVQTLMKDQAYQSYKLFSKYPVSADAPKDVKERHLEALRKKSPGSIVVQTIRLGRVIGDAVDELYANAPPILALRKQEILICPLEKLFPLFKLKASEVKKTWRNDLPLKYAVNQTIVQIAWVMGYFSHYDRKEPVMYLDCGLPFIESFVDFTRQLSLRVL